MGSKAKLSSPRSAVVCSQWLVCLLSAFTTSSFFQHTCFISTSLESFHPLFHQGPQRHFVCVTSILSYDQALSPYHLINFHLWSGVWDDLHRVTVGTKCAMPMVWVYSAIVSDGKDQMYVYIIRHLFKSIAIWGYWLRFQHNETLVTALAGSMCTFSSPFKSWFTHQKRIMICWFIRQLEMYPLPGY